MRSYTTRTRGAGRLIVNKAQYFLLSIILVALASSLAYAAYPLNTDESMSVLNSAGQRRGPGFVSGIAGAGSVEGYFTITGIVVGHGTLEAGEEEVPYIVVATPEGKTYTVILGSKFEEHMRHEHWGEEEIRGYPERIINERVTITGIKTSVDDIVIATNAYQHGAQIGNANHDDREEAHWGGD